MELYDLKDKDGNEVKLVQVKDSACWFAEPVTPEPKFKVGDWIWLGNGGKDDRCVYRIVEIDNNSQYPLELDNGGAWGTNCRLATKEEIESHLRRIAEEKGYKGGLKLIPLNNSCSDHISFYSGENTFVYKEELDRLELNGTGIYQQGKWAEIVPSKKKMSIYKETARDLLMDFGSCVLKNKDNAMLRDRVDSFLDQYED